MPFPSDTPAPAAPSIQPQGNVNYLDNLIGELSTPKEQILKTPQPGRVIPLPGQEPAPFQGNPEDQVTEPGEPISPESARKSGERIAKMFDQGFSFGAMLYAKGESPQPYKADEQDLKDLSDVWADVAAKHSWKIEDSPWLNVLILVIAVYYPKFMKAGNDRRFAQVNHEIEEMKIRQAEDRARINEMEKSKTAA